MSELLRTNITTDVRISYVPHSESAAWLGPDFKMPHTPKLVREILNLGNRMICTILAGSIENKMYRPENKMTTELAVLLGKRWGQSGRGSN